MIDGLYIRYWYARHCIMIITVMIKLMMYTCMYILISVQEVERINHLGKIMITLIHDYVDIYTCIYIRMLLYVTCMKHTYTCIVDTYEEKRFDNCVYTKITGFQCVCYIMCHHVSLRVITCHHHHHVSGTSHARGI